MRAGLLGKAQAVRAAPWVVEEEKKLLNFSLVGFLKPSAGGEPGVESWLVDSWGKMPVRMKLI